MVGTVAHTVTRCSWISPSASSGVKRPSGMISFRPARRPTTRVEWQPDTWKRGEVNRATFWPPPPSGMAPPPLIAPATAPYMVFCRLATMLRWVEMAPLGRPVVPDV